MASVFLVSPIYGAATTALTRLSALSRADRTDKETFSWPTGQTEGHYRESTEEEDNASYASRYSNQ